MGNYSECKSFRLKVLPESDIRVSVTIGDAQPGGWAISLGEKVWKGSDANPVSLGKGNNVLGSILQVSTLVIDQRPETNRLLATVTIAGGATPFEYTHAHTGNSGDTATYTTVIAFD